MVSVVILALALVAPAFAFPSTTTGIQGSSGTQSNEQYTGPETLNPVFTQGGKTGVQGSPEVPTGVKTTDPVTQYVEQNPSQGSSESYSDPKYTGINVGTPESAHEEKTGSTAHTGTSAGTYVKTSQPESTYLEQTAAQGAYETPNNQQYPGNQPLNTAVPKAQATPVYTSQAQTPYTESPVLLPLQPLAVLPVNQGLSSGQVLSSVAVPAEAIATGRVIILTVEPTRQQTASRDASSTPEKQVPYQQVAQQAVADNTPVQVQAVQPSQEQLFSIQPEIITHSVEKQPYQQTVSDYSPVQAQVAQPYQPQLTRSQQVSNSEIQPVGDYTPVQSQQNEPGQQSLFTAQPIAASNVEKQATQSSTSNYVLQQTQNVEPNQQQVSAQPSATGNVEKQASYQQSVQPLVAANTPVQSQGVESNQFPQVYNAQQVTAGQVENQAPFQKGNQPQSTGYTQNQAHQTQAVVSAQQKYSSVQPQVANYVANNVAPNFGDKLSPQQPSVQTLAVSTNQEQSVSPSSVVVQPQQQQQQQQVTAQ